MEDIRLDERLQTSEGPLPNGPPPQGHGPPTNGSPHKGPPPLNHGPDKPANGISLSDNQDKHSGRPHNEAPRNFDYVLINELGQFGRFQLNSVLPMLLLFTMHACFSEYVFSAAAVPHRCSIPECGESPGSEYILEPEWLANAVPSTSNGYDSCNRFAPLASNGSLDFCPTNNFDPSLTQECDGFIYDRTNSVVYEFDLGCQEWIRALAGTLSSVGSLLNLPLIGYISDKYGRRAALILSVLNTGIFGLIRAFSVNYPMYLFLQILQSTLGAGIFSSAYIYAAELVGPKYRVLTSATCSSMFAVGQVILGGIAWAVQPWRYMIIAIHVPCFIVIIYYWILPESIRWLLSKQKYEEARIVLERASKVNKKEISEKSMQALLNPPPPPESDKPESDVGLFRTIIQSRVLLRRVLTTPIWWVTTTFVYYGLSINATGLSGNMYANYMAVCAIEIPGYYTALLVLDRIGRKATLACGFFLSAICCFIYAFVDISELEIFGLILFLVGKFGISAVFTSLYLFTSELYPTEFRHTLLAFSSMIGRVGSITAPLTPALLEYWEGLPGLLFASMAVLSGVLVLTQPETLGTKLPDTLAEAEALGTSKSKAEDSS